VNISARTVQVHAQAMHRSFILSLVQLFAVALATPTTLRLRNVACMGPNNAACTPYIGLCQCCTNDQGQIGVTCCDDGGIITEICPSDRPVCKSDPSGDYCAAN
jgi:hypothetical protein